MNVEKMIDVSSNNHPGGAPIGWDKVADAGYRAVMIKATESVNYINPWLHADAHGARAAGLHVGYYWFAHPADSGAEVQALYCLQKIEGLPRDIGVACDLEVSEGKTWAELATFARAAVDFVAAKQIGSRLYTDSSYLNGMGLRLPASEIWFASWGRRPRQACWAWQEGYGVVPGCPNDTDYGLLFG